jgi:hypothetical protein
MGYVFRIESFSCGILSVCLTAVLAASIRMKHKAGSGLAYYQRVNAEAKHPISEKSGNTRIYSGWTWQDYAGLQRTPEPWCTSPGPGNCCHESREPGQNCCPGDCERPCRVVQLGKRGAVLRVDEPGPQIDASFHRFKSCAAGGSGAQKRQARNF